MLFDVLDRIGLVYFLFGNVLQIVVQVDDDISNTDGYILNQQAVVLLWLEWCWMG